MRTLGTLEAMSDVLEGVPKELKPVLEALGAVLESIPEELEAEQCPSSVELRILETSSVVILEAV